MARRKQERLQLTDQLVKTELSTSQRSYCRMCCVSTKAHQWDRILPDPPNCNAGQRLTNP
jgi:hypothetical protein